MRFIPHKLVPVTVGCIVAKLYPLLQSTWPVHKHVHAFKINKASLKSLPVDITLILNIFGSQLNSSTTIKSLIQDWQDNFNNVWVDF